MKANRTPQSFNDADGRECARVPLAKPGQYASLWADDLRELEEAGVPLNWYSNLDGSKRYAHVKVAITGDNVRNVARLIVKAQPGERVHYRDGNRFNLRRDNLVKYKGGHAKTDAQGLLDRQSEAHA